jgi:hypothetical protein
LAQANLVARALPAGSEAYAGCGQAGFGLVNVGTAAQRIRRRRPENGLTT